MCDLDTMNMNTYNNKVSDVPSLMIILHSYKLVIRFVLYSKELPYKKCTHELITCWSKSVTQENHRFFSTIWIHFYSDQKQEQMSLVSLPFISKYSILYALLQYKTKTYI